MVYDSYVLITLGNSETHYKRRRSLLNENEDRADHDPCLGCLGQFLTLQSFDRSQKHSQTD